MALSSERVRITHLLRRAGFGANEQELQEYLRLGFDGAVSRLIDYESQPEVPDAVAPEQAGLQMWWLNRMLRTQRPLQEKMTLFWHGHLTSGLRGVKNPGALLAQNQFFRANALAGYRDLLRGIARDPAMIQYLDLRSNRRVAPNENFGRELLELFTMGIGNYTEEDVKDVARAYTGWTFGPDGQFFFNRNQHDFGPKTILGQTGNFDGDDVAGMLAEHPATGRFMARKLFRFFAYPSPEQTEVDRLAEVYLGSGGSIKALVESILRSAEFSSEQAYRATIKSPTELIVGTLRTLSAEQVPQQAVNAMRQLGQELFNPPNVAGWFGGRSWVNAATLLVRFNTTAAIANQLGTPTLAGQPPARLLQDQPSPAARVDRVVDLLLDGDASPEERATLLEYARNKKGDDQVRSLFRLAMALPAYQLN